jgi:hypothetical protein
VQRFNFLSTPIFVVIFCRKGFSLRCKARLHEDNVMVWTYSESDATFRVSHTLNTTTGKTEGVCVVCVFVYAQALTHFNSNWRPCLAKGLPPIDHFHWHGRRAYFRQVLRLSLCPTRRAISNQSLLGESLKGVPLLSSKFTMAPWPTKDGPARNVHPFVS